MGKRKSSYTPVPSVPPEMTARVAAMLEVLAGRQSVSEAARSLGISRNHFQTLLHRGLAGLTEAIAPKAGGRPAKAKELSLLEARLEQLRRENRHLQQRLETTDRLLQAASGLLHGRLRPASRQARTRRTVSPDEEAGESEPRLAGIEAMRRLGIGAAMAARIAGVHPSTARRWKQRERTGHQPASRVAPEMAAQAATRVSQLVRDLHGLVGAEALRHSVAGISRRAAARIKAATLTEMERERKSALMRVTVSVPGVMRALDGMHLRTREGASQALFAADAAVPYRTAVKAGAHYDARLVARTLAWDIEHNGAPLVYRLDRALAHEAREVREVLAAYHVLVLHGPPHYPAFYGQLERQNREHRAWLYALGAPRSDELQPLLERMLLALNSQWRRRTLGWKTATQVWQARPAITVDRVALNEEVCERAARIRRKLQHRGNPADLAQRHAIEQALQTRGFLRQTIGGWC